VSLQQDLDGSWCDARTSMGSLRPPA